MHNAIDNTNELRIDFAKKKKKIKKLFDNYIN